MFKDLLSRVKLVEGEETQEEFQARLDAFEKAHPKSPEVTALLDELGGIEFELDSLYAQDPVSEEHGKQLQAKQKSIMDRQVAIEAKLKDLGYNPAREELDWAKEFGEEATGLPESELAEVHLGFKKLKRKLAHKKGIYDPAGLAAKIGRDKYGKKKFAKMGAAGRKKG